jgi:hypothetical protein
VKWNSSSTSASLRLPIPPFFFSCTQHFATFYISLYDIYTTVVSIHTWFLYTIHTCMISHQQTDQKVTFFPTSKTLLVEDHTSNQI